MAIACPVDLDTRKLREEIQRLRDRETEEQHGLQGFLDTLEVA